MYNSYLNIVAFLLTTLFYFIALRPSLTLNTLSSPEKLKSYETNHYVYLAIYLLLVIIVQFIVNTSVISSTCGGSVTQNLGSSAMMTFFPWFFIFGVVIIVLVALPGFKSAFSDVIGYYYVSNPANDVLTTLLINQNVEHEMNNPGITDKQKETMQRAADMIVKICGNSAILINQIVPYNFLQYWSILTPLMKPKYQQQLSQTANANSNANANANTKPALEPNPIPSTNNMTGGSSGGVDDLQKKFFDLVLTRDNIGEVMWYIYTGILICSLVQLQLSTVGCTNSPATMQQNYQAYLQQQETIDAQQQQATSTVYTLS
jgi:hypothetical protein